MAEQYNRPSILLGFVDAEIFGKDAVGVDFKVNKIGGNPVSAFVACLCSIYFICALAI